MLVSITAPEPITSGGPRTVPRRGPEIPGCLIRLAGSSRACVNVSAGCEGVMRGVNTSRGQEASVLGGMQARAGDE